MIDLRPLERRLGGLANLVEGIASSAEQAAPHLERVVNASEAVVGATTSARQAMEEGAQHSGSYVTLLGEVGQALGSHAAAVSGSSRKVAEAATAAEGARNRFVVVGVEVAAVEHTVSATSTKIRAEVASATTEVESQLESARNAAQRLRDDTIQTIRDLLDELRRGRAGLDEIVEFLERSTGAVARHLLDLVKAVREGRSSLAELARFVQDLERGMPGFSELESLAGALLHELREEGYS